jgi:hypothetical protein
MKKTYAAPTLTANGDVVRNTASGSGPLPEPPQIVTRQLFSAADFGL